MADLAPTILPPPWLRHAKEMLERDVSSAVRMQRIAQEIGVHPVHLSRAFRRFYGTTMSAFLRKSRIERARHELLTTKFSVGRIAVCAGFADHAHFTRVFKQATGRTPVAFRREHALLAGSRVGRGAMILR